MWRNDDPPETGRSRLTLACLALLVVPALAARVWGSFLGLPHAYLPDERAKLDLAERLPKEGFRSDGKQPGFLPLSLLTVRHATRGLEPLLRGVRLPGGNSLDDPSGAATRHWIARLWLDLVSAATVPVAFLLARRLAGRAAGVIAAALLVLDPLAIASASYVKEDTPLTLWFAATTLAALELGRRRTRVAALVAGAMAGLALGSKYVGVMALPLLGLALCVRPKGTADALAGDEAHSAFGRGASAPEASTPCLAALAAAACAIMLTATTPAILLAPLTVARGLRFQANYATTGHHDGIALPLSETWGVLYLRAALLHSLGPPALAAALVGLLALLRRDRGASALLAASTLGLLLVVEALPAKPYPFFARYALPAIPGLCALAGVGCVRIASWLAERRPSCVRWHAVVGSCVVVWPLVMTLRFTIGMYPDTRDQAAAWLLENAAPGDWVLVTPYAPTLPPGRFKTWPLANEPAARRLLAQQPSVKYIVLSDLYTARYVENPDDAPERTTFITWLASSGEEVARFAANGPRAGFFQPTITVRRIPPSVGPRADASHPRTVVLTPNGEVPSARDKAGAACRAAERRGAAGRCERESGPTHQRRRYDGADTNVHDLS
jgi:hypothetical protein